MRPQNTFELSESAQNVIENIACLLASGQNGRLVAAEVLPYLPVSLGMVESCLDAVADGTAIIRETEGSWRFYRFVAYEQQSEPVAVSAAGTCVACDKDPMAADGGPLCSACSSMFRAELDRLAERTGWPGRAVYEHEILYHAAGHKDAQPAETLAAKSRYTLRNMRRKLHKLAEEGYAERVIEGPSGVIRYRFPPLAYPAGAYRSNMAVIRSYPASVVEEVQRKVAQVFCGLGLMFLGMLVLGFFGFPLPLLLLMALVLGPLLALLIWRRREALEED